MGRLTEEALAILGHLTQLRGRVVQRAQISVLISQGNELGHTDRVDVTQRTATEWRETNTVHQAHVGFGGGFNDAVFQATHGFQAQGDHHPVDDVLVGHLTLLVDDRREYFVNRRVGHFLLLALLVGLVGVETLAVLLAQALGLVERVDRRAAVVFHAVREAFSHHVAAVVAGVDADHVHQVRRAHGPAEFFHDLVDTHKVHTGADQLGETAEVREQHAVDQEARAVVDHDRVLAHFLGVGNGGGDGQLAGLLATDHFHQRHHVYRVEEVHADEVFRTLEGLGQQRDGNGRGVGRQDSVVFNLGLHFSQHRLLDLRVFDNRFDHQVDVAEIAVGQGWTNAVEHFSHFRSGHATFINATHQQLGRFRQALLDAVLVDVFHQDRRAFGRRLIGNTAAHDTGAEYGGLFHVFGDFIVGLGLFLQFLIVQEQANQALGSRGLRQFDETSRFHFQGFVATEVRGFLDGLDRFNRCRVVRAGLAGHETFGGFERHHLFDGVELEFFQLRLTLGLVVKFAVDGALDQVQCRFGEFVRSNHGIDSTDFQRVFSLVFLAGGDPLDGVIGTDDARQAHGAAEAQGVGAFRGVLQRRVVERQLLQGFTEVFEVVGAHREQAGVNLRLDALEARQHVYIRGRAQGQGVTDRCTVNVLDTGDDEAYFTGLQVSGSGVLGVEYADAVHQVDLAGGFNQDLVALLHPAVAHTYQGNNPQVVVEPGVDDQRLQRIFVVAGWRRNGLDQALEHF